MKTVPQVIVDNARGGAAFIYIVEIFPRGSDFWSVMRWAEKEVTIDGDLYESGYLNDVSMIRNQARIISGGGVATRDSVTLELNNKDNLHMLLQSRDVEGRDVRVSLVMFPTNILLNSGFEDYSGADFDYWTETKGHATNIILPGTGGVQRSGSSSVLLLCNAAPGPQIECDAVKVKKGATVTTSFYAKATSSGDQLNFYLKIDGKYWNDSTKQLQSSPVSNSYTPDNAAYERFTVTAYDPTYDFSGEKVDCSIIFEVPVVGDSILVDDVMIEERLKANAYHGSRHELTASDVAPQYYGEMREPLWDVNKGIVTLKTKSISNRRRRKIPIDLIAEGVDADWVIPPQNVGKPYPMTYGDLSIDPDTIAAYIPDSSLAMGYLVNHIHKGSSDPIRVAFDSPRSGITLNLWDAIYHMAEDGRLHKALDLNEWDFNSDNSVSCDDTNATYLKSGRFAFTAYLKGMNVENTYNVGFPNWTAPDNAIDLDPSSLTVSLAYDAVGGAFVWYSFEGLDLSGSQILGGYFLLKAVYTYTSGGNSDEGLRFGVVDPIYPTVPKYVYLVLGQQSSGSINNIPWAAGASSHTLFPFTAWATTDQIWKPAFWAASSNEVTMWLYHQNDTSSPPGLYAQATVYEIAVRIDAAINILDANIFANVKGREFGTTWGGRKTAGNMVENPSELIEAINRHELGSGDSDINTATFDASSTARSTYKMAGQLLTQEDSDTVKNDIASLCGLVTFTDIEGKDACIPLDYGAPDVILTERDFMDGSIVCGQISRDDVINNYVLKYAYNSTLDEFTKSLYCNKDAQNIGDASYQSKCSTSYTALGNVEMFREFELKWCHDETTAIKIMKWLINWNYLKRLTVMGDVTLEHLGLEFGDRIGFDLPRHLLKSGTDADQPVFVHHKDTLKRSGGYRTMEFLQVLKP